MCKILCNCLGKSCLKKLGSAVKSVITCSDFDWAFKHYVSSSCTHGIKFYATSQA